MAIERPWAHPDYKGKLKPTPSLDQKTYPTPVIDDCIGTVIELLIQGIIDDSKAKSLLEAYDKFKAEGYYFVPG